VSLKQIFKNVGQHDLIIYQICRFLTVYSCKVTVLTDIIMNRVWAGINSSNSLGLLWYQSL